MAKSHLLGIYDSEDKVLVATRAARDKGWKIHDVYTPYAVHGMDEAMGLRSSRLPWVTFCTGLFGLIFAMVLQSWTSGVNWPINVGGKPFHSYPAWIPVAFELTVLIGALSTVLALLIRCKLRPGAKACIVHPEVTDDVFVLAIDQDGSSVSGEAIREVFNQTGAVTVRESGV